MPRCSKKQVGHRLVYLVRGSVLSLSFVEPHTGDKPKKPNKSDEPDPRHAPRNVGLQDLTPLLRYFNLRDRAEQLKIHEAMVPKLCGLRQWERLNGEEGAGPPRAGKFRMSPFFLGRSISDSVRRARRRSWR